MSFQVHTFYHFNTRTKGVDQLYIVKIDIETDGDFTFSDNNIEFQLTENYNDALILSKTRLTNIIKTISGSRKHIVENAKKELFNILEILDSLIENKIIKEKIILDFDCGNQYGAIEISSLKQEISNNVVTFKRK